MRPEFGNSGLLVGANLCAALSYALTRFGPWGQANFDGTYAGPQGAGTTAEAVLWGLGVGFASIFFMFGTYEDFVDKCTQVNAIYLIYGTFAFFAGRYQTFTFQSAVSLSTENIPAGAPNKTVSVCTYNNVGSGTMDCNYLAAATAFLAFEWLLLLRYYLARPGVGWFWYTPVGEWELDVYFPANNLYRVLSARALWRTSWWNEDAWFYSGRLEVADRLAAEHYVNGFGYNAWMVGTYLIIQSIAQASQYAAVDSPGNWLQAQFVFSLLSLISIVIGWFLFCFGGLSVMVSSATAGVCATPCWYGSPESRKVYDFHKDLERRAESWEHAEKP